MEALFYSGKKLAITDEPFLGNLHPAMYSNITMEGKSSTLGIAYI